MGPKNARDASGIMMISGDPAMRARLKPQLESMTGQLIELGDDPGEAAAFKFAQPMGIAPPEAHKLFSFFMPVNAINFRGKDMAHGDFTPQWELKMARKDVRLMLEEAARHAAKDVGVVSLQ